MEQKEREVSVRFSGLRETFVLGGTWTVIEENLPENGIFSRAKKENDSLGGKFSGAAFVDEGEHGCAYGLFSSSPKRPVSLAACVAKSYHAQKKNPGTAEGVFYYLRNPGKEIFVWFVSVMDGIVQVGGDRILDVKESFRVEDNVRKEYASINIRRVEEPKDSFVELSGIWKNLSSPVQASCRIRPFVRDPKKTVVVAALSFMLFASIAWGVNIFLDHRHSLERVAERERIEREARTTAEALEKSEFPLSWMTAPRPSDIFSGIERSVRDIPLSINGWSFAGLVAENGKADIFYTRQMSGPWLPPPGKTHAEKPALSVVSMELPIEKTKRGNGILKKTDAETWLMRTAFGLPGKMDWKLLAVESRRMDFGRKTVSIVAPYQKFRIDITRMLSVAGMGDILDIPGLVVEKVERSDSGWSVSALLYVLP